MRGRTGLAALAAIGALGGAALATAPGAREPDADAARVKLRLLGRFSSPTYLAGTADDPGARFVVERAGRIRVVRSGRVLPEPFLDISSRVSTGGESGMLSMAFAPDYGRSRRFYVYFTDTSGDIRVEQFERSESSPDRALPGSARVVIQQEHHRFNHKGGQVHIGPDGLLWMAFGDGGGGGDPDRNAQNLGRLLGKVLRVDPKPGGGYTAPRSNPFAGRRGARPEVFAYGLRNPWRFSFDRRRGHLTIADVGQDAVEEVDYVRARRGRRVPRGGYNFGWPAFEGRERFGSGRARGHVPPAFQHTHDGGFCTVIGGYVIRDPSLGRRLQGRYLYGDLCDTRLRAARLRRGRSSRGRPLGVRVPGLVSFAEDAQGRLYAISLNGPVYRLAG